MATPRQSAAARSSFKLRVASPFEPPGKPADPAFDEYVSDPLHPVEYIDQIEIRMTGDYMIQDQRGTRGALTSWFTR